MIKNVNETLCLFIGEGPVWDALNNLQAGHTRYSAYAKLLEIIQTKDIDALDQAAETGQAMYLAEQLIGQEFWPSVAEAIKRAIRIDTEDRDLTENDGAMLQKILRVSVS